MTILFTQLLGGLGNQLFQIANLYSLSIDNEMDFCITDFSKSCTPRQEEEDLWLQTIFKNIHLYIFKN